MRKLMIFSIGFSVGCGLSAYLLPEYLRKPLIMCLILSGVVFLISAGWGGAFRVPVFLCFGCTAGLFWFSLYSQLYLSQFTHLDGQTQYVEIRAADYGYDTEYGTAFDGTILLEKREYKVKTYLKEHTSIKPADLISGSFRFCVTIPGAAESSGYYQGNGIFLLAYQREDLDISSVEENWKDEISKLRQQIKAALKSSFPEDTFAFAQALLLGDTSGLGYDVDTDLKISGIRHVVAVSGLHVSVLFTLLSAVTLRKRYLTAFLGLPSLFLFAALAGFTPSVVRACIMSALMLIAPLSEREYDGATALSFSVLIMLLINPFAIASISLQLSSASVAGILLFHDRIKAWLLTLFHMKQGRSKSAFIFNWLASSVSVTLSSMSLTTPFSAGYFGTVSLISIVTNLLTLWIISFVFYGILAVCFLWLLAPFAGKILAGILSWPIRYVLKTAHILAGFPLSAVYTRSVYVTAWLILVYILLFLYLVQRKRKANLFIICSAIGLCIALLTSWSESLSSDLRFSVLDVGQGQCLLLQYRDTNILVDCGGDSDSKTADIAAETLLSQGITKLDYFLLTHLDRDHAGGAINLLSRIKADLVILPPVPSEIGLYTAGKIVYASEDLQLSADGLVTKIFTADFAGNSNEMSLCILFQTEKCDILITSDRNGFGERSLLRNHDIPDVDILVAGHHGSGKSTCDELLQAVRPEIVCISVGRDNSYGHPSPELLERLYNYNCTVYRTDRQGTILIRR